MHRYFAATVHNRLRACLLLIAGIYSTVAVASPGMQRLHVDEGLEQQIGWELVGLGKFNYPVDANLDFDPKKFLDFPSGDKGHDLIPHLLASGIDSTIECQAGPYYCYSLFKIENNSQELPVELFVEEGFHRNILIAHHGQSGERQLLGHWSLDHLGEGGTLERFYPTFPIKLIKGTSYILAMVDGIPANQATIKMASPANSLKRYNYMLMMNGAFAAFCIGLAIYAGSIIIALRQLRLLVYGAYVLLNTSTLMFLNGFFYFIFPWSTFMATRLAAVSSASMATCLLFTRFMLNTAKLTPRMDVILQFLAYAVTLLSLWCLTGATPGNVILMDKAAETLIGGSSIFVIGLAAFVFIKTRSRTSLYFLLGWGVYLGAIITYQISVSGVAGSNPIRSDFLQYAAMFEMLMFAIALSEYVSQEVSEKSSAQERAEVAGQAQMLLRLIGHDLSNHLSVIHLVASDQTGADWRRVQSAATHQRTMLDRIKSWSAIKRDQLPYFDFREFQLSELESEIRTLFERKLQDKSLRVDFSGIGNQTVNTDRSVFISTILGNLVSNALKFSPLGGLIEISSSSNGEYTSITVKDWGPGIDSNQLHTLFDEKANRSQPGSIGESGTGLGLPLAYLVAIHLGGGLTAQNHRDERGAIRGAVFTVSLPSYRSEPGE